MFFEASWAGHTQIKLGTCPQDRKERAAALKLVKRLGFALAELVELLAARILEKNAPEIAAAIDARLSAPKPKKSRKRKEAA